MIRRLLEAGPVGEEELDMIKMFCYNSAAEFCNRPYTSHIVLCVMVCILIIYHKVTKMIFICDNFVICDLGYIYYFYLFCSTEKRTVREMIELQLRSVYNI